MDGQVMDVVSLAGWLFPKSRQPKGKSDLNLSKNALGRGAVVEEGCEIPIFD